LWTREGIRPGTELFGDSRFLYAVGPDEIDAVVFNAVDGTLLGSRRLPPKRQRKETIGSRIVTWGLSDNRQVLSLHDPWTGTDVWSHQFEDTADAVVIESDEALVLEPSGKVSCVTLADGNVRFVARAEAEPRLSRIHAIRSRDEYVLIANEWAAAPTGWGDPVTGAIPVQGRVYGYDRQTGKRLWTTPIERQGIDLRQPSQVPVLTFVCRFDQPRVNGPGIDTQQGLTILDKRNGRVVFDNRDLKEKILFIEYTGDADQKLLEMRMLGSVVRLTFTDKPFPDE
jgi:outer membrane protein assembly factor BamB